MTVDLQQDRDVTNLITRRCLTAGIAASVASSALTARADTDPDIAAIERRYGGRLGLFVLDTGSGRTLAHRGQERFLMCSTFKGVLAACVLSHVDAGRDELGSLVRYGTPDLLGISPVTTAHVGRGTLSVGELCAACVLFSDNAAANLLLKRIGGPAALTAFVRGLGDRTTRFDRNELSASIRAGALDTTTPRAIVATVRTLLLGDALSRQSRARLEGWMIACRTGEQRLRASFPADWIAGDKTGTGDGNCNDYAIVRRPGRAPLVIAAYYDAPGMQTASQEAALRTVGSAIVRWAHRA